MKYFSVILAGVLVCVSGILSAEYEDSLNRGVQNEVDTPQVNRANEKGKENASEGKHALEYLDDVEDESEIYSSGKESTVNTKSPNAKKRLLNRSSSCNTIWMRSYNKYAWSHYVPGITVKTRLWLKTNTYLGGSTDPNLCGKPAHYSSTLRHHGKATAIRLCSNCDDITMAQVNNYQANNASWITSYRKHWKYGLDTYTANCARSKHYSTNNGSTFSRTLTTDC